RPASSARGLRDLPAGSSLEGPRPLLRVLPRRQRRRHRRQPPDRLDGARRQAPPAERPLSMLRALQQHWPEYLAEALGLGLFMMSACGFGTLLGHPASPAAGAIPDGLPRRLLMGLAMGLTAVALIYSPWGRRSGAHLNPATTLTFWRLGKVAGPDAAWYVLAQALGGIAGVLAAAVFIGPALAAPSVHYVATMPGPSGVPLAFLAETIIAFVLMTVVLRVSNTAHLAAYTGI